MKYIIKTHDKKHGNVYLCGLTLLAGKKEGNFWTMLRKNAYRCPTPELAAAIVNLLKCLPQAEKLEQIQVEEVE